MFFLKCNSLIHKISVVLYFCCIFTCIVQSQIVNDKKLVYYANENYVKDRNEYLTILKSKMIECKCIKSKYIRGFEEVTTINLKQDTFIRDYKNSFEVYRKNSISFVNSEIKYRFFLKSKFYYLNENADSFRLFGMAYDSIFVVNMPQYDSTDKKIILNIGYNPNELYTITYSTKFNDFLFKLQLIKRSTYYRRLKCIDFKKLYNELMDI